MRISDWSSDVCSSDLGSNPLLASSSGTPAAVYRSTICCWKSAGRAERLLSVSTGRGVNYGRRVNDLPSIAGTTQYQHPTGHPSLAFVAIGLRSEEHTSELQSLMRISSAVFCLKNKKQQTEE